MESTRAFANKIWNAARLIFMNMERSNVEPWVPEDLQAYRPEGAPGTFEVPIEDRWIFSRLNHCADRVSRAIDQYRYHEAAQELWEFFWHEFCDWYLELKKLRLEAESGLTADWRNLLAAFEGALRLLHPVMPFLTEELWQRLAAGAPNRPKSIALARYPEYTQDWTNLRVEREIQLLQDIVSEARKLRAEMKLDPKAPLEGVIYSRSGPALEVACTHATAIQKLANVKLDVRAESAPQSAPAIRSTPEFDLVLNVPRAHVGEQRNRLEKEQQQLEKNITNARRQLSDQTFLGRAPDPVIQSLRTKLAEYEAQLEKVRSALVGLAS
jgi:valyl-tRNA synthetase